VFASPSVPSLAAERAEQLARLVYELLDAHSDTEQLCTSTGAAVLTVSGRERVAVEAAAVTA